MALAKQIKPLKNPVSVTANLLLKGSTVYLKADATWSENIADSAVAHDREQETALLALANITEKTQYVVGAYSFGIKIIDGKATPLGMREIIRAKGIPTIVPDGLTTKPEWQNQFTADNANSHKI
uniref:DUF2849 domain-containing protein n=1 Tax=OCS116 cluster bacterium TaxID=2030921 RepID=A0A2A4Z119_9PROT